MDKRKYTLLGLLPLVAMTLAFILSFEGCTPKPTEAPTTTVITGTGQLSVAETDKIDTYTFSKDGATYGNIKMVWYASDWISFEGYGIMEGSGATAPDSGYGPSAQVGSVGTSYFIKTDDKVHYARILIATKSENTTTGFTAISFQWVLQTEANNRNLY